MSVRLKLTAAVLAVMSAVAVLPQARATPPPEAKPARAVMQPKPLGAAVEKGLAWLVEHQLPNGGWGQGEESTQMGMGAELKSVANVADTSMAALALLRSGTTPKAGRHSASLRRGVEFVLREIEASDQDSLYVTQIRGTRVQSKIGPYVDTFVAATLLAEVKGKMPDAPAEARLGRALAKVLAKIERNQRKDGTFSNEGWAPVLSQAMAAKGLNRAAQAGAKVDEQVLQRVEENAKQSFDASRGMAAVGAGSAGVELYGTAAGLGALGDSVSTREQKVAKVQGELAAAPPSEENRRKAKQEMDALAAAEKAHDTALAANLRRLKDPSFVAGFGSNGGEEFLSYMLVSETLRAEGGAAWEEWDASMAKNLARVQNDDGSWTGHHCITGRTFCTAAALLVLMADRAPVPLASKIAG